MKQNAKTLLCHPYSLIGLATIFLILCGLAGYWQYERSYWQDARRMAKAYTTQLERRHDRTIWLTRWQANPAETLTSFQTLAAREGLHVLGYDATGQGRQQYAIKLEGTFLQIVSLLQALEGQTPPVYCQSISIRRSEVEGILVCEIFV